MSEDLKIVQCVDYYWDMIRILCITSVCMMVQVAKMMMLMLS